MFSKYKDIFGTKRFYGRLTNGYFLQNFKEEIIILDNSLEIKETLIPSINVMDLFEDSQIVYFINSWDGKLYLKNSLNKIVEVECEFSFLQRSYHKGKVVVYNKELTEFGVFLLKERRIIKTKLNSRYSIVDNDCVYFDNDDCGKWSSIVGFNISLSEESWRLNINNIYERKQISALLLVYEQILIVGIGEDILIGLDTKSGSIVWQINECNNTNYVLDKRDGKLKGVTSIGYFEVEIKTGVYKRTLFEPMEKLFDDPTIFDSQRDNFVLVNNHIITTDYKRGIIGAFNTKTLQYDWFHEEKGVSFPGAYPIKYFEPYLFVMDSKETLHIFKKEKEVGLT